MNKQKESLRNVFRHKKRGNSRNALFTMCADVCETWRYAFIMMSELRLRPLDAMKGKIVVFVAATRVCPRPHSAIRHSPACRWRTLFLERGASNDRNVGRLARSPLLGYFLLCRDQNRLAQNISVCYSLFLYNFYTYHRTLWFLLIFIDSITKSVSNFIISIQ